MVPKALLPMKAAPIEDEGAWFAGKIPRRLLAIPFGGPIPSKASPLGVDLDGEWFDAETDIYGNHRFLRQNRERLADWHHRSEPVGPRGRQVMGRTVIGKAIVDLEPDEEGWWVDFWFKAGEQRVRLIETLAKRGAQLFGSSEPIPSGVRKSKGHIEVWPFLLETLSTSPQNTQSTLRPMKALLADAREAGLDVPADLAEYLASDPSLPSPSEAGETSAKAGRELSGANEAEIEAALEDWQQGYTSGMLRLKKILERMRQRYRTD